jgi:hypothetical protein
LKGCSDRYLGLSEEFMQEEAVVALYKDLIISDRVRKCRPTTTSVLENLSGEIQILILKPRQYSLNNAKPRTKEANKEEASSTSSSLRVGYHF